MVQEKKNADASLVGVENETCTLLADMVAVGMVADRVVGTVEDKLGDSEVHMVMDKMADKMASKMAGKMAGKMTGKMADKMADKGFDKMVSKMADKMVGMMADRDSSM